MSVTKHSNPYSDGSPEDNEYWKNLARERRENMNGHRAISKVLVYLEQGVQVLELEIARYDKAQDIERHADALREKEWFEGMIYWINHNV